VPLFNVLREGPLPGDRGLSEKSVVGRIKAEHLAEAREIAARDVYPGVLGHPGQWVSVSPFPHVPHPECDPARPWSEGEELAWRKARKRKTGGRAAPAAVSPQTVPNEMF
jgi:hypothetical protein